MAHIDRKVTVWIRDEYDSAKELGMPEEAYAEMLKQYAKDGVDGDAVGFRGSETLFDTEEQMSIEQNGGMATIYVSLDDDSEYTNSNGFKDDQEWIDAKKQSKENTK